MIVCDTDILSTFGKVKAIDLLNNLFNKKLIIPYGVYEDLMKAKDAGYDFVDEILDSVEVIILNTEEFNEFKEIFEKEKSLHKGEIQGIVIAKHQNILFLTNDKSAKRYCGENNILYMDLEEILRAFKKINILSNDALENLIDEIERKERTKIKAKNTILED
jgi:predicted nucleic acid-binding protein